MMQKGEEKTRRAREGLEQKKHLEASPNYITLPEGRLPAGDERSDHKVELHSPEEQRDLVIVRSDLKKARELWKNLIFLLAPDGIDRNQCF